MLIIVIIDIFFYLLAAAVGIFPNGQKSNLPTVSKYVKYIQYLEQNMLLYNNRQVHSALNYNVLLTMHVAMPDHNLILKCDKYVRVAHR